MRFLSTRAALLSAALCVEVRAQEAAETASPVAAVEARTLIEATHERLVFDQDVTTVAVGRSQTLKAEIMNSRELLLLGLEPGRTSLLVWFLDGTSETLLVSVEPDLSLLRAALRELHPSITAEVAPDRFAVVLRGLVPDLSVLRSAEAAASSYLDARARETAPQALVAPGTGAEGDPAEVRSMLRCRGCPTATCAACAGSASPTAPARRSARGTA